MPVLGLPTGSDTLVREIRRVPVPAALACSVVSVDDWCRRRGQTYGAILVDLARHQVVDLLPDREADTFAAWLQRQPQIRVISRDRGANFAEGATRGAPQAIQVADRFHILKNLVAALQHVLGREQAALRTAARAVSGTSQLALRGMTAPRMRARAEAQARRQARYDAVHRLRAAGKTPRQIIAEWRIGPNTLRRYVRTPPPVSRWPFCRRVARALRPLRRICASAGTRASRMDASYCARSVAAATRAAAPTALACWLALWRVGPRHGGPYARRSPPAPAPSPSLPTAPRTVCWLLLPEDAERSAPEQAYVAARVRSTPRLARLSEMVRAFFSLRNERRVDDLEA